MDAARRSERERVGWVARRAERVLVELVHRWSRWSERRVVQGGFPKMSYFRVKTVFLGHFWVKKRDFRLFLGQNMLFYVFLGLKS